MGSGNQAASAACRIAQRLQILPSANLVHRQHLRCHGANQHHHSLGLWTAIQHIASHPHIILGNSLKAGRNLRPLVHNPYGFPLHISTAVRNFPHKIAKKGCFPAAGRGEDEHRIQLPPVSVYEIREHGIRTSSDFVGYPDIQAGNRLNGLHPAAVGDSSSRHPDPVSARHSQKPLSELILKGVERISGRAFQSLLYLSLRYHKSTPSPSAFRPRF